MPRGRKRKNQGMGFAGFAGMGRAQQPPAPNVTIISVDDSKPQKQKGAPRMSRGKGKRGKVSVRMGGRKVDFNIKDIGTQVVTGVAEYGVALASACLDLAAASSDTKADDTAVRIGLPIVAQLGRWGADTFIAKKSPHLAYVVSHAASALAGHRAGVMWSNMGIKAIDGASKKLTSATPQAGSPQK